MSDQIKKKKGAFREWIDSVVFAVVAATLIRFFLFEAYTIPTPSMESSLMVGDFLFVSKMHYGVRSPKTPLQVPLTHQKIWGTDIPSYLTWLDLPIFRLPGFTKPQSGDAVVFNVPNFVPDGDAPIDLRTYYIKRCIATPGDKLEVRNQQVFLNDKPMVNPVGIRQQYFIFSNDEKDEAYFRKYKIENYTIPACENTNFIPANMDSTDAKKYKFCYFVNTTKEAIDKMKAEKEIVDVRDAVANAGEREGADGSTADAESTPMQGTTYNWNRDFYGPLVLPKKGMTITLDAANIDKYKYVIKTYEDNKNVIIEGGKISIDGKPITSYTFKQDYYFMMGDNRHNSADSRYWGFVPDNHIVGKAVFIWMSLDPNPEKWYNKIRWNRLFSFVN